MKYNSKLKDIQLESWDTHRNLMTLSQLQIILRLATAESMITERSFPFCLYDELYKFNRKQSVLFLMTGVADDFFSDKLQREIIISLVGKYYLNKHFGVTYETTNTTRS